MPQMLSSEPRCNIFVETLVLILILGRVKVALQSLYVLWQTANAPRSDVKRY